MLRLAVQEVIYQSKRFGHCILLVWGWLILLPAVASEQVPDTQLEEVSVSARKWEENIRQVPITLYAYDQDDILQLDLIDLAALASVTTAAQYVADNGNPFDNQLIIRGGGVGRFRNLGGGTGLYANGIDVQGGSMGGNNLWNLDRFDSGRYEVLKGPQGALYGRGALGGAVNVRSVQPDVDSAVLKLRTGLRDNDGYGLAAYGNLPVVEDVFAVRVAARYYDQDKGFRRNTVNGEHIDDAERENLRIAALWKPGHDWTAWFQYDHYDAKLQGNTAYDTIAVADPFRLHIDDPNEGAIDEQSLFASLEGDLDWATFTVLVNLRERDAFRTFDLDEGVSRNPFDRTMQVPCFSQSDPQPNNRCTDTQTSQFEKDSLAARLVGTKGGLHWLVGADVFQSEDQSAYAALGRSNNSFRLRTSNEIQSWSVYGGGELALGDDWQLGLQLRYTREERDIRAMGRGVDEFADFVVFDTENDASWNYPTWVVHAAYDFSKRVRGFARVGSGYRSGGLNFDARNIDDPDTGVPIVVPETYDEEKALSYELGLKSLYLDGALSLDFSTFYVDYDDFLSNGNNGLAGVDRVVFAFNRGRATAYGAEMETQYKFTLGPAGIKLRAGISWNDSELKNTVGSLGDPDPASEGLELSRLPDWTYRASIRARAPVASFKVFGGLRYSGQQGGFQTFNNDTDLAEPHLFNLKMGIARDRWRLTGNVSNLTDEGEARRFVVPNGSTVAHARNPRSWWLAFEYDFL